MLHEVWFEAGLGGAAGANAVHVAGISKGNDSSAFLNGLIEEVDIFAVF